MRCFHPLKMPWAFRFRLYPNSEQEERMLRTMEACRRLWNDALAHRKLRWEKLRQSTSYNHQAWVLTAERHADPALAEVYSQAAQDVLRRLDRAFEAFFEGRSRHPRFKKLSSAGSFAYPQAYNGSVKPDVVRRRLFLSKVGNVKAVFHRPLPKDARVKTCTVVREPDGEWYASLVYDEVVPLQDVRTPAMQQQPAGSPVGVDLGLLSLIATSDGEKVEHPKLLRKAEKRLKRLQRSLSRKRKGSNNRSRARHRLASQHARVRRQRADLNHKLSTGLVKSHSLVAFEDLKVRNMVRNRALAKSIHDAGWSQLVRLAEYKASRAGKLVVRVPAAYSTQECSFCGALNKVPLSVRQSECASCGRTLDRDVNAARIVLKRGLAQVGQGMPELKPAETGPLPVPTTGRASQAEEAGTIRDVDRAARQEARRWKPTASVVGGCHGKALGGGGLW
jgi:putative transposase